jgi:hypothetical protein
MKSKTFITSMLMTAQPWMIGLIVIMPTLTPSVLWPHCRNAWPVRRLNVSHIYKYQFTPDVNGSFRAVVMPVMEHGRMVDIVAFRQSANRKKPDVWATVTGAGRFLNRDAIYDKSRTEPLIVCQSWWQWVRTGCSGVLPLRVSAIPELRDAGDVVVCDSSHAQQLLFEAYLWPTNADPSGMIWKAAREKGRHHIIIDDGHARAAA